MANKAGLVSRALPIILTGLLLFKLDATQFVRNRAKAERQRSGPT